MKNKKLKKYVKNIVTYKALARQGEDVEVSAYEVVDLMLQLLGPENTAQTLQVRMGDANEEEIIRKVGEILVEVVEEIGGSLRREAAEEEET